MADALQGQQFGTGNLAGQRLGMTVGKQGISRTVNHQGRCGDLVKPPADQLPLLGRVMPGHIQVTRLLLDPLSDQDLDHLREVMTRVRDHMRAQPPRSAAPRKRRPTPA